MRHKPYSRGVQYLTYVGDDAAPAAATAATTVPKGLGRLSTAEKVAGGLALYEALFGRGLLRVGGIAVAGWLGYKATR